MIEVPEAEKIILNSLHKARTVTLPLGKAMGRILREDVFTDMDFPPFNRVMMDGVAINFETFANGRRDFKIAGVQAAGTEALQLSDKDSCMEVMTGAVLPNGTDTVIPYEQLNVDKENSNAFIEVDNVQKGSNIHLRGTDKKAGEKLISKNTKISAAEIAVMASVGKTKVKVAKNPSIAIISTGDELVEIDQQPLPHQIRRSNVYGLLAELNRLGLTADLFHINDEKKILHQRLKEILEAHDVLLMSGGVSMGKFDFVPEVLQELGVEKRFHKIKQKPGKPFWFGEKGEEKHVFAFPGNPVSTFMCFHRYFIPWLQMSLGMSPNPVYACLSEEFSFPPQLTYFLQVKTSYTGSGLLMATPSKGRGSGDHANLLDADGFLELPANASKFKKGEAYRFFPFRFRI